MGVATSKCGYKIESSRVIGPGECERTFRCTQGYCICDKGDSYTETYSCPTDGGWTKWTELSHCDEDTGTQFKTRSCTDPSPMNGGKECEGEDRVVQKCSVDGGWSPWGDWTPCIGQEKSSRKRTCTDPSPKNGGLACEGDDVEYKMCPVHGEWSEFGEWGECDKDTGIKSRTRACDNPAPMYGGRPCEGSAVQSTKCPVDGGWSSWSDETSCINGTVRQFRRCDNPTPKNGGKDCEGNELQATKCMTPSDWMLWVFILFLVVVIFGVAFAPGYDAKNVAMPSQVEQT